MAPLTVLAPLFTPARPAIRILFTDASGQSPSLPSVHPRQPPTLLCHIRLVTTQTGPEIGLVEHLDQAERVISRRWDKNASDSNVLVDDEDVFLFGPPRGLLSVPGGERTWLER